MPDPEAPPSPRFYFALPRLLNKIFGGDGRRTDSNWLEANSVGAAIHAIVYVFVARCLLSGLPPWQQAALLLPLVLVVLLCWMVLFAIQSLMIRAVRAAGMLRDLPEWRVQGVLVAIVTTVFAWELIGAGSWMRVLGSFWIAAVSLNLLAACILAFSNADRAAVV
jgi:uncharacterized membrane protein YhdT